MTGQSNQLTGDKMATCVAGYLPKGSFAKPPDVSWMCGERDPREGGMKLRAAVVQGAPAGAPSEAMKLFSRLGWYELAAFAVILTTAVGVGLTVGFATCPLLGVAAGLAAAIATALLLAAVHRNRRVRHAVMELMHRITGQ